MHVEKYKRSVSRKYFITFKTCIKLVTQMFVRSNNVKMWLLSPILIVLCRTYTFLEHKYSVDIHQAAAAWIEKQIFLLRYRFKEFMSHVFQSRFIEPFLLVRYPHIPPTVAIWYMQCVCVRAHACHIFSVLHFNLYLFYRFKSFEWHIVKIIILLQFVLYSINCISLGCKSSLDFSYPFVT